MQKKEQCCICGKKESGEKIADGWVCNDCIIKSGGFLRTGEKFKDVSKDRIIKATEENNVNKQMLTLFNTTKKIDNYLFIDEEKRQWYSPDNIKEPIVLSYDDIIDFQVLQNGETIIKGGTGAAVAGGLLFGGVGAATGAALSKKSTKEIIETFIIKITTRNRKMPTVYIYLLTHGKMQLGSSEYNYISGKADAILSALMIMRDDSITNKAINNNGNISNTDEIRKYKQLLDEGIISREEFDAKKKQLLGL